MGDVKADDYLFLPADEAVAPAAGGFFQHYVNHWWTVHPERGLVFYNPRNTRTGRRRLGRMGAPQCNTDERITRLAGLDTAGSLWPEIVVRLIPSVWVPVDIRDYRQEA